MKKLKLASFLENLGFTPLVPLSENGVNIFSLKVKKANIIVSVRTDGVINKKYPFMKIETEANSIKVYPIKSKIETQITAALTMFTGQKKTPNPKD